MGSLEDVTTIPAAPSFFAAWGQFFGDHIWDIASGAACFAIGFLLTWGLTKLISRNDPREQYLDNVLGKR